MSAIAVIVNPHAQSGQTGRHWPRLEASLKQQLGAFRVLRTERAGHARALAQQALNEGSDWLIAVGGDGTVHEVVNGMIENDQPLNPQAVLSVLMSGTGADFQRSFATPRDLKARISALRSAPVRSLDIGKVTFQNHQNQLDSRYFVNIGSFGLGGDVVNRLEKGGIFKKLGGKAGFMLATLQTLSTYHPHRVRLRIDDSLDLQLSMLQVAVANGRFHGGGMQVAPLAESDDGWFDLVILTGIGTLQAALLFPSVYQGRHLGAPAVRHLRCRQISAEALGSEPIWLELDGESPGKLPAHFELLPGLLRLRI
jgi:diacylglycerol kinase (ATP)